jgi:hypothetical protein
MGLGEYAALCDQHNREVADQKQAMEQKGR